MESLPLLVAEAVAKYLMPRDLAACCAVSVHWRDIFGTNKVWKPLCDVEIEEYLRTTPCLVDPAFSVPLQDSALVPLSQWRLAFLRERHLWSNWRKGNCKTVKEYNMAETGNRVLPSLMEFVGNDFVIIFKQHSVELWDAWPVYPVRVDSLDLKHVKFYNYIPTVFENGFVVLNLYFNNAFRVLKADVIERTISVRYKFLFNQITYTPELVRCSEISVVDSGENAVLNSFRIIIKKGRFCIGYFSFRAGDNTFNVWNLDTVVKLKQESFPTASNGLVIVDSRTCDDVLVLVPSVHVVDYDYSQNVPLLCRVYDVQNLEFFPFSKSCLVNSQRLIEDMPFDITNNFVALTDCDISTGWVETVRIFNYRTDQQLYLFDGVNKVQVLADSCFIFKFDQYHLPGDEPELHMRLCLVDCLSGHVVKDVTGSNVLDFEACSYYFFEVLHPCNKSSEFWGINKLSLFKTAVKIPLPEKSLEGNELVNNKVVNRACTKLMVDYFEEFDVLQISHFWYANALLESYQIQPKLH